MKHFWWKLKNALQTAVAPTQFKCLNCGTDVFGEVGFCKDCLEKVTFNNGKTCLRCGVALHGAEDYCGRCAFEKTYFDRAYSPFCYDGAVQKAILDMKFNNLGSNARVLAAYLVFAAQKYNLQFDVVTFVPMSPKSQKKRGYNQSQLLAEHFCYKLDIDFPLHALTKTKETARQETLGKKQRQENLVGAFSANDSVRGKRVLLIDDVKTTGATLNECAKALKRKGATQVIGLTVASREERTVWEIEEEI